MRRDGKASRRIRFPERNRTMSPVTFFLMQFAMLAFALVAGGHCQKKLA